MRESYRQLANQQFGALAAALEVRSVPQGNHEFKENVEVVASRAAAFCRDGGTREGRTPSEPFPRDRWVPAAAAASLASPFCFRVS